MKQALGLSLLCLAGLQIAYVVAKPAGPPEGFVPMEARLFTLGDTPGQVAVLLEDGAPGLLDFTDERGRWTVLLAYYSECAFCDRAAPVWQQWLDLQVANERIRTVGVTRDTPRIAVEYRDKHHWKLPVVSVAGAELGTPARNLVARTPWIFVFDPDGVLQYQGNGAAIDPVDQALQAAFVEDDSIPTR